MAGPMQAPDRTEDQSATLQQLTIQNVIASPQGTTLFQFQPIPESTPRLERNDLEQQRAAAPNQLMGFVATGDEESFTARGNQIGLVDPSATYRTAEEAYLDAARNMGRERGRSAVASGNAQERNSALDFLQIIHTRIAARQESPEQQDATAAQLTRDDAAHLADACTNDQCRIDLLNAMAAEGFHAQTLLDLQNEWNLTEENQQDSATMQIPLGADGSFEQPLMFAIQEGMRQQLDDIRTMQQKQMDPAEIRRSDSYRRLASMAGARRAEQAAARVARGESSGDVATSATSSIYARHLLDTGNLSVVPVRRQIG